MHRHFPSTFLGARGFCPSPVYFPKAVSTGKEGLAVGIIQGISREALVWHSCPIAMQVNSIDAGLEMFLVLQMGDWGIATNVIARF